MHERLRTDYHWTPRQRQVLDLIAEGKSNAEIAAALDVSLQGAKWHVSEVMSKLQADTREEAADYWRRYNGLAPRFARVFRGLVGLSTLKWAGAAAGIAAVVAGGNTIAAFAAGGGDDGAPAADVSPTPTTDDALARLRSTDWILVDVAGVPAIDGVEATLSFTDPDPQPANVHPQPGTAGYAGGQASCNGFNGGVDISGDRLIYHGALRTLMSCNAIDQEERYLEVLSAAERFAFDGDQLLIFAAGYDLPLRFAPRPASASVPTPTPTPDPPFEGTLAGIQIMAQTDDISPFEICPEVGLEPLTVPEAQALVAADGPFTMNLAALPAGVTLSDLAGPDVFTCRAEPVSVLAGFRLEPGTADVSPGGGTVLVSRTTGPPQLGRSYPRNAWAEIPIAEGTGLVLTTPTGSRGAGCSAAYWDEAAGIFTWVSASAADAPLCERMLRAIVE